MSSECAECGGEGNTSGVAGGVGLHPSARRLFPSVLEVTELSRAGSSRTLLQQRYEGMLDSRKLCDSTYSYRRVDERLNIF
jgi:hypothetical protein